MSISKRKLPSDNGDGHNASKRIKLTNHSHSERERSFVLHSTKYGEIVRSTEYIDFATVVPESITSCHAPDKLETKGKRRRWREEMRARAIRVQSQGCRVATKIHLKGNGPKVGVHETGKPSERVDVKRVATTMPARSVMKRWHAVGEYRPVWMEVGDRGAVRASDVVSKSQPERMDPITSAKLRTQQQQESQPRRAMPIYRPPGLKRFEDVPTPSCKGLPRIEDSDESIESESDSSEDEGEADEKAPVRGSMSESFADRIFATQDDAGSPNQPSEDKDESADSAKETPRLHFGDHIEAENIDQTASESTVPSPTIVSPVTNRTSDTSIKLLPSSSSRKKAGTTANTSSSLASDTATGTDQYSNLSATRPANMVAKKSLAESKAGGNHSGSGRSSGRAGKLNETSLNRMSTRQEFFDPGEESEDLYQAIEDVTEDLLGECVLSMDQCKIPHPRDSACEVDLDTLMTFNHSARKVPTLQDAIVMMVHDNGSSFDNWALVDADMRKAQSEPATNGGALPQDEQVAMDRNSHDVVAEPAPPSSRSSSSSDLSELSRSPSPPSVDVKAKIASPSDHAIASGPSAPIPTIAPGSPRVIVPLRRKMTGMSSNHFSSAKKLRTRKSQKPKDQIPAEGHVTAAPEDIDSPLTALQTALDRTVFPRHDIADHDEGEATDAGTAIHESAAFHVNKNVQRQQKKTSKRTKKNADAAITKADVDGHDVQTPARQTRFAIKTPGSKQRSTGKISEHFITDRVDFYNTSAGGGRIPAGTSRAPVPSINAAIFGLIQEKIWREPFWLIIAVTFLNKTAGRSAVPVFWKLKEKYPSSKALAEADQAVLLDMVRHLGLQNQRSKRLIQIAKAWTAEPPVAGKRYRTLNYPTRGDGKASTTPNVIEEDAEDCAGLLEIGNIPGCGQYAYDSWRIFCRDALRGVADDYNGANATAEDFVPEWQRVLPDDKELRACLRWMWLREGWIWDPLNGEKRRATEEEMEKAVKGEMEIEDPQERRFAAQAAGVEVNASKVKRGGADMSLHEAKVETTSISPAGEQMDVSAGIEAGQQHDVEDEVAAKSDREDEKVTQEDHSSVTAARRTSSRIAKIQASPDTPRAEARKRGRPRKSDLALDTSKGKIQPRRLDRRRAGKSDK